MSATFRTTRRVLRNITPDQMTWPTPCASWDVRRLVNHLIEGAYWFEAIALAGAVPDADRAAIDYASEDFVKEYTTATARTLVALRADGALAKMIALPFGTYPGAAFMGLVTIENFTHAWDIAKATGQPTDLDRVMAHQLLTAARSMIPNSLRGLDTEALFGPEVIPPAYSSAADHLAAFLGRDV